MNKWLLTLGVVAIVASPFAARAEDMTGVTATEIRIGNTMPYSGPAAAYGTRAAPPPPITTRSTAPAALPATRSSSSAATTATTRPRRWSRPASWSRRTRSSFIYAWVGTAPSLSVRKYLNEHHVPQIGIASGASAWNDPEHYPYSISGIPSYTIDGQMTSRTISWTSSPTPRSRCCIRTTISAAIISPG